ncbi:hypothetical protein FRC14_003149 [Serendipita sp. 396]|nr:hypothetical protein FRC14_003149 [Serendipita sp. 396]KAG8774530.1 hypothetical protein FRC15_001221 [Serendipita sp. 397]
MGFTDTLYFDGQAYMEEHLQLPTAAVTHQLRVKNMQLASSTVGAGAGVGLAVLTLGLSLAGAAYAARQIVVLQQQIEILKSILALRDEATMQDY